MVKVINNPLDQYIADLFAPEDEVLRWIQSEADRNDLPPISILPDEGRMLQLLIKAIGARSIVEIGVLGGYSGVWMARALPADGKFYALEKLSKHAQMARNSFERAGLGWCLTMIEGDALDSLQRLTEQGLGPFDFVFIDADKVNYTRYLTWAGDNLRTGGMMAAHNALRGGRIMAPDTVEDRAMAEFNRALAADARFDSTILAVGDGMAVGIRK